MAFLPADNAAPDVPLDATSPMASRAMQAVIHSVLPGSIADELGIVPGTQLLAVNGRNDLEDQLDYQFVVLGSEMVELHLKAPDGSEEVVEIELDEDDDTETIGLVFERPIFTPIKTCNNACPFCFIDQQPAGLRPSLYIKDDDWRLSYFNQTYITLTNLTPRDRQRLSQIRPGPLCVSVHCTVPAIRERLLANPKHGGKIMDELRWLDSIGIPFHAQVVICPSINDGEPLSQTLADLWTLNESCLSVAVIPVGLTQHRDKLTDLKAVDQASAQDVVTRVSQFTAYNPDADGWVFCGDEFYHKAGLPLPSYDSYGEFEVLEDGVGTARHLSESFFALEHTLPKATTTPRKVIILTGKLAAMTLQPIAQRLNEIDGLYVDVLPVESGFWGQQVDVAGLITGQDLITACQQTDITGYDFALIPSVMLKQDTERFLDDVTVTEVSQKIGLPVQIVTDPYNAKCLINLLLHPA